MKFEQGLINGKGTVFLEWLIWHECVGSLNAQDEQCDIARWVLRPQKENSSLWHTQAEILLKSTIPFDVTNKNVASLVLYVPMTEVSWQFCSGPNDW